jgi:hypothetical protein
MAISRKEKPMAHAQVIPSACRSEGLAEILERVLDKGVVIAGDIRIKICDIELLSIQIRLLVCSVDKAREMGMTWWWQQPQPQPSSPHIAAKPAPALDDAPAQTPWGHYVQYRENAKQVK